MAAVADENDPNNESNVVDNDISNNKHSSSKHNDDDKNIHVPKDKKLKIDYVSVKEASIQNDVCFYDIHVRTSQHSWHVTKRFSEFEDLHHQLLQLSKDKLPLLPGKHYKWFTDHTKPKFIEKRRALLDNYVKKLIQSKGVSSSQCVVNFFHKDKERESPLKPSDVVDEEDVDTNDDDNDQTNGLHHRSPSKSDGASGINDNLDDDEDEDEEAKERDIGRRLSDDFEFPADQEVTNVVIQSTRKMTDHVLYQICVSNSHKRASFRAWTVLKRFTQFYEMDVKLRASLQSDTPNLLPNLPPAPHRKLKFVHDHMDDDFIEERRVLLENYLSKLLRYPEVVNNADFLEFLGVDM